MSNKLRRLGRQAVLGMLRIARRSRAIRYVLDIDAFEHLKLDEDLYLRMDNYEELDRIYGVVRRKLYADRLWRLGPPYVWDFTREAYDILKPFTSLTGKIYADVGCGDLNPLAISTVMHLNGAKEAYALDISRTRGMRAAEALYELLLECLAFPDIWCWGGLGRAEFEQRIRRFELKALKEGNLAAGIANVPLRYVVEDIHKLSQPSGIVEVLTTQKTLEHFLDLPVALKSMANLMAPGGIAYHHIDLRDHRAYYRPRDYHFWSFMAEDEAAPLFVPVNRLRSSEIRQMLTVAGYDILKYDTVSEAMPDGFRGRIRGRFSAMSEEDLSINEIRCVLRKPR